MKKTISFVLFSVAIGSLTVSAAVDCTNLSLSVKNSVSAERARVLEIVAKEVSSAPSCACEIVKVSIEASHANIQSVAAIVEAASIAAPEQMRLVSQCAVAVAPDALSAIQTVIAKLDPNRGESAAKPKSAKDSKSPAGEVAAMPNPLDFPGQGPIGPTPGGPGGIPLIPLTPPVIISLPPEIIAPPNVTNPNPRPRSGPNFGLNKNILLNSLV